MSAMNAERIAEIRGRLGAATPGPWDPATWNNYDDGGWAAVGPHHECSDEDGCGCADEDHDTRKRADRDAAFIAHAPADLADALDALEELRALLRRLEWVGHVDRERCYVCNAAKWHGHAESCELAEALR